MKQFLGSERAKRFLRALERYKYILLLVLAGIVILLLPPIGGSSDDGGSKTAATNTAAPEPSSVAELEERMEQTLSQIDGAGRVSVVLSLKTGTEQVLAQDSESSRSADGRADARREAVIVTRGSGLEDAVVVKQIYPEYRGAVVVCEGADSPTVRLRIMEAVSALTGLGTDKISISKMKER